MALHDFCLCEDEVVHRVLCWVFDCSTSANVSVIHKKPLLTGCVKRIQI